MRHVATKLGLRLPVALLVSNGQGAITAGGYPVVGPFDTKEAAGQWWAAFVACMTRPEPYAEHRRLVTRQNTFDLAALDARVEERITVCEPEAISFAKGFVTDIDPQAYTLQEAADDLRAITVGYLKKVLG